MIKRPERLWAVWGNRDGLKGPKIVKWDKYGRVWWTNDGLNTVIRKGLDFDKIHFSFADVDLKEVNKFIRGYKTCARVVHNAILGSI